MIFVCEEWGCIIFWDRIIFELILLSELLRLFEESFN